jgi:energy-coupling factor transport system substrate-specific component
VKNLQMVIKLVVGVALAVWGITLITGEAVVWQTALVLGAAFFLIAWFLLDLFNKLGMKGLAEQYTTYDIMVMAVLIAAGGVVKAYWGQVRMILESIMGPYATFIIGPGFYFWAILACYLVRKPLSGTISMVLGGVVEILAGNPFGLPVLAFNFWEGLGPDIAYGIFGLKRYTVPVAILAGLLASYFGVFYGWYYFGFEQLPPMAFLSYLGTKFLSGVIAGLVGHYLGVALEKVGVRPPAEAVIEEA